MRGGVAADEEEATLVDNPFKPRRQPGGESSASPSVFTLLGLRLRTWVCIVLVFVLVVTVMNSAAPKNVSSDNLRKEATKSAVEEDMGEVKESAGEEERSTIPSPGKDNDEDVDAIPTHSPTNHVTKPHGLKNTHRPTHRPTHKPTLHPTSLPTNTEVVGKTGDDDDLDIYEETAGKDPVNDDSNENAKNDGSGSQEMSESNPSKDVEIEEDPDSPKSEEESKSAHPDAGTKAPTTKKKTPAKDRGTRKHKRNSRKPSAVSAKNGTHSNGEKTDELEDAAIDDLEDEIFDEDDQASDPEPNPTISANDRVNTTAAPTGNELAQGEEAKKPPKKSLVPEQDEQPTSSPTSAVSSEPSLADSEGEKEPDSSEGDSEHDRDVGEVGSGTSSPTVSDEAWRKEVDESSAVNGTGLLAETFDWADDTDDDPYGDMKDKGR